MLTYDFPCKATSVLLPAAQIAGHNDVRTLEPYLAVARKRLTGQTRAERAAAAEEKALAAERRSEAMLIKLKTVRSLHELAQVIESGNRRKIATALKDLYDIFESGDPLRSIFERGR